MPGDDDTPTLRLKRWEIRPTPNTAPATPRPQPNHMIGTVITNIEITPDRLALRFTLVDGSHVVVAAVAQCCSYSWIEHVELPALGFPAKVISIEGIEMPAGAASSFHADADVLAFYGCKILTDRGEIVIDYRNDSNGSYGGSLAWPWTRDRGRSAFDWAAQHEWLPLVDTTTSA